MTENSESENDWQLKIRQGLDWPLSQGQHDEKFHIVEQATFTRSHFIKVSPFNFPPWYHKWQKRLIDSYDPSPQPHAGSSLKVFTMFWDPSKLMKLETEKEMKKPEEKVLGGVKERAKCVVFWSCMKGLKMSWTQEKHKNTTKLHTYIWLILSNNKTLCMVHIHNTLALLSLTIPDPFVLACGWNLSWPSAVLVLDLNSLLTQLISALLISQHLGRSSLFLLI